MQSNRSSSIISRITGNLGTLKTLSQNSKGDPCSGADSEFVLFTHHKKRKDGVPLDLSYTQLREAALELFLSVKIRDDCEIDEYNHDMYKIEKQELDAANGFDLIDMIKDSIEKLMNMNDHNQTQESRSCDQ